MLSDTSDFTQDAALCSILPATPSILNTLREPEKYNNLRGIYLGGEPPSQTLIKAWHSRKRRVFNCYGPTETTCASLIAELLPDAAITLGLPTPNSGIVLLDTFMNISLEGEICISGPGLARGYLQNEELTSQKFCQWDGTRIYRTGDIAKQTEHGLEYVGRKDALVKNRGFLINLEAQVTPALQNCPGVTSATAIMNQGRLIGFVTPARLDTQMMRTKLASTHDSFIVPDNIYSMDSLPLTSNGKIDNRKLKESLVVETEVEEVGKATDSSDLSILRKAISLTLGIPLRDIDNSSSFWQLGGNSLAAVMLLSHLRVYQLSISVAQLFHLKNITEIAQALTSNTFLPSTESQEVDSTVGSSLAIPMTTVQLKMIRTSINQPLMNYMLLSISIDHKNRNFDTERFQSAWHTTLHRHSIFRTSYDIAGGVQLIAEDTKLDWEEVNISPEDWDTLYGERVQQIRRCVQQKDQSKTTVDPPTVFRLITIANERSCLLWMVHHSRVDGWSMGVIFEELQAILDGRDLPVAPKFSEVAFAQDRLVKQDKQRDRQFWAELLEGHLPPRPLLLPKPDISTSSDSAVEQNIRLDMTPAQLDISSRSLRVSSATIIYSAWAILLSNYCATDRVTFGAVFSGRNVPIPSAARVVGPLVNTCPFPIHANSGASVSEIVSRVQERLFMMNDRQWSANEVLGEIAPRGHAGLFNTIVALQFDLPEYEWSCQTIPGPWHMDRKELSEFALTVLIECEEGKLVLKILFDPSEFEASTVRRMLEHFRNLLLACLDPSSITIGDVRKKMLDQSQLSSLTNYSPTLSDPYIGPTSVKTAFEIATDTWPDMIALDSSTGTTTYRELDEVTNCIANHLSSKVGPGDNVAIVSDASLFWIVSILSVIKTGATYCPIDVKLPQQRARVIINESKAVLCLIPNQRCKEVFDFGSSVETVLVEDLVSYGGFTDRLVTKTKPLDPVCIVFTSGSTGTPKGVQANHLGILSYVSFPPARLHAGPGRRNAQLFSVGFDACTAEIFGTLCYGATLVLKSADHPFSHLQRADATMATPSFLATCRLEDFENLDTIVLGGEAIPQSLADNWSKGRRLYNGYGPCECTVGSVFKQIIPGEKVTLGKPIPRMIAYVLDEAKNPVPIGVSGEIYLSGTQVTAGYFNLEAKTKACFLPDPFANGKTMYRTGDLGRWTESMELEFIGRVDSQVKVRGFRVDLGEIEHTIHSIAPDVSHVAVIVHDDSLLGFVTPETVSASEIRKKLESILPNFSRPSQIITLKELPMSVNQKIDRKALGLLSVPKSRAVTLPSTKTEEMLARAWQDAIGAERYTEVSADDDFMDIGGHSLLQIKVGRRVSEEVGQAIPLSILIRNPILSDLGKAIDQFIASHQHVTSDLKPFLQSERIQRETNMGVSHLEEDMLIYHLLSDTRSIFNMACHIEFRGALDLDVLERAIFGAFSRTEVLRSRYKNLGGQPVRQISPVATPARRFPKHAWNQDLINAAINEPFDLANEQPIRATIFESGHESNHLLLVAHHIVADKAALAAILEHMKTIYTSLLESADSEAPNTTSVPKSALTYLDWAHWAQTRASNREAFAFWQKHLRNAPPLPFSHDKRIHGQDTGASSSSAIGAPLQESILQLCQTQNVTPHQLLLAAIALTIHTFTDQKDIILAVPYMDRYEDGTSSLPGLLLDRQPIRLQLLPGRLASAASLLASSKESVQEARANYIPFTEIRKAANKSSLFDVMVTYHNQSDSLEEFFLPGSESTFHRARASGAKFPLMFEFVEEPQSIKYEVEYNTNLFNADQIEQVKSILHATLNGLCQLQAPSKIMSNITASKYSIADMSIATEPTPASDSQGKIDIVREAFAEVLNVERATISCKRTFSELGGSSLLALRVKHLLKRRKVEVGLGQLLALETAEKIASVF